MMCLKCLFIQQAMGGGDDRAATLVYGLISPACYAALVEELTFDDASVECLKGLVAKLAGYGIITFSFLLKAPQIAKIVGSQSVLGLSAIAMYSETVGLMLNAVYNFLIGSPLSSYGEMVCILAQNIVLVALLWYYMSSETRPSVLQRIGIVGGFVGLVVGCLKLPEEHLWLLPFCNMPITLMSRLPQIFTNWSNGHTGQLAAITLTLNFLGVIVRILTTIQEVGFDVGLLSSYGLSFIVNGILVLQVVLYWKATTDFTSKQSGDTKAKKKA